MERPLPIVGPEYRFYRPESADLPAWQSYPEIPTARDLNPDWQDPEDLERIHSLLPNNWQHPFPNKNTYLETHYRLQREEAIAMLRFSVKKYREDSSMEDDDETCIYTKVFVQGYLMTRIGPMCRIQFSTQRAGKKIRWIQTRRLTTGSLVAISTAADGFKTICMPAVVADRPFRDGLDRNPPTIQIFWGNTDDAVLDPTTELVMLESRSGYFEAVRHCMVGLQHVAGTDTPLDKYLVSLDKSDLAAKYVRENPEMNISSLVHHIPGSDTLPVETVRQRLVEARESLRNHRVLDSIDSKISTYTNLDNSQLSGVHRILTKELGIIQGPPGTGKTFTSVQALQILLDSQRERGSNIIILAAQTNHAVDQILSQLIDLGFNTVRLGGRTQNEEIKRYNMYNLRRRALPSRAYRADGDYKAFEAARRKTVSRIEVLVASIFSNELIDPEDLQAAGIITQKQLESLLAEDGWAHASSIDESSAGPLSQWLGDQRVEAPSMDVIDPDFDIQESDDTADFDAEDYDIELDDCIADDDENSGRVDVIRKELRRENLWEIGEGNRGAIYQWHRDLRCIRTAQIEIYRGLLAALKPRTMLIEEAAETKEASILSALYPSLQQLILVGDHQQLKPSCDTPFLDDAPYYIRVSMFERLIGLDMPPILREVLNPFYPNLQDHPVVRQPDARPSIPGMAQQSFFFHHTKFNLLEGEMITEITILSEFSRMKHRQPFKNVHTVDSYQGEENDIVILSLVRSNGPNGPHKAGFLRDSNRGVVAISRARRGFYIFGNMINLWNACKESQKMWGEVAEVFRLQNRLGLDGRLPITCQQHSRTTWISHPDEWINHHGGCMEPCVKKLECGHDCGRRCHWVQHSRLICLQACERVLSCGHPCEMYCGENCQCRCDDFTGAYANDEAWDDDTVRNGANDGSSAPRCATAPFTGSDGRIGQLRSDFYGPRGRRGGFARGSRSTHTSDQVRAQGYPVRSNMLGREWALFDAQQHDAQRRQEYRQSAGPGSSNPVCPSAYNGQDPRNMINPIRETFRQVTLNPRGMRNVKEGVVSEKSRTPTPEKLTGDLLSFRDAPQTENPVYTDPAQPQKVSAESLVDSYDKVRESALRLPDVPNGCPPFNYTSHVSYPPQPNVAMKTLPRTYSHGPNGTRNANRARVVEDRPEWEDSSTVCETHDDNLNLHGVAEGGEGNLIDL
ncbi:hypothetical protein F4801DRAFT_602994 [Xylaria longipes]|nr:hypothetical protein F4801DRAFT_602994 [Xylaria longipes]